MRRAAYENGLTARNRISEWTAEGQKAIQINKGTDNRQFAHILKYLWEILIPRRFFQL